jgi:hypothetical protein
MAAYKVTDLERGHIQCPNQLHPVGTQMLVMGIVERACKDIGHGYKGDDAERFFRSDYFRLMCPRIDGDELIKQIKKNLKEYGYYAVKKPKDEEEDY